MSSKLHIDENVNILTGAEAEQALQRENDQVFLSDGKGVTQVTLERWNMAQRAERRHWLEIGRGTADDRNHDHMSEFDGYSALAGKHITHAIELGCGPFTNLRLLGGVANIDRCTLLDPLIESYLTHNNVQYSREVLFVESGLRLPTALGRKVSRRVGRLLRQLNKGRKIPVERMLSLPIETMPLDGVYDLTVLINVIEHCYDIEQVFSNILAVTQKHIVFHDKYYLHDEVSKTIRDHFDAAHPLRVDRSVIDAFLHSSFTPLFHKTVKKHFTLQELTLTWEEVYYIGERV